MDDQPATPPDRRSSPPERTPARPGARPVGPISRYLGSRLLLWGRLLAVIGVVLLAFIAVKVLLAYTRHKLGGTFVTAVAGGAVGIALISVGESMSKSGASYLRGERHLARSIGRRMGRRRLRRSRPPRR